MGDEPAGRPSALHSLRRLGATSVAILHNRLELLLVELQEAHLRITKALLLVAVVAALACFTVTMAALGLAVVVWNNYGAAGLFVLSGIGLAATLVGYWRLRVHWRNWALLSQTVSEIRKDLECLEKKD